MSCSAQCRGVEGVFDARFARRDLRRYRRKGPRGSTRALLTAIQDAKIRGMSLLDIGGGVGAITHALLEGGVHRATLVEASAPFADAARDEAGREGHADRLEVQTGDFVAIAAQIPEADIVTLDRVICCYPDMPTLVARSTAHSHRLYGAVFPRDSWWVKLIMSAANLLLRLSGKGFRVFVHPERDIDDAIRSADFRRRYFKRRLAWVVALYERVQDA